MKERLGAIYERFLQPESRRLTLVDIGASGGMERPWNDYKDYVLWIAFEPDDDAYRQLVSDRTRTDSVVINSAVGERSERCQFYITRKQGHSSVFRPNFDILNRYGEWPSRSEVVKVVEIQVEPLDDLLAQWGVDDVDFIKLDTQGSELAILRGGTSTLQGAFGVEVEVEFVELYSGQPLFADVDIFMRQQGFELIDLRRHHELRRKWREAFLSCSGQLVCGDALYLKSYDEYVGQWVRHWDDEALRLRVIKAVCVCLVYGLLDLAAEFIDRAPSEIVAEDDKTFLMSVISRQERGWKRQNPLKTRVGRLLKGVVDKLHHRYLSEVVRKDGYLGSVRR